ncbi:MAG: lipoprotein signal peptidase [Burkholderiales bacterium]|nr:lipoprotein signal peptidase [Burkholderiales bacterium]
MRTKKIPGLSVKSRVGLLLISLGIVALDQITKAIVRKNMVLFMQKYVNEYWNWILAYNQGAAFSLFAKEDGWQRVFFGVLASVVSIALVFYILNRKYSRLVGVAISFILGGAVGNLVDRVIFGKVTDFIDWHYMNHHWPAFNIADSFITVGVTLLIIDSLLVREHKS